MSLSLTTILGLLLIAVGEVMIPVIGKEYRSLGILVIYIGGMLLLIRIFSLQSVLAFLASGLGISIIFASGHLRFSAPIRLRPSVALFFRLFLSIVLCVLSWAVERKISKWIPLPNSVLFAAIFVLMSAVCDLFFTEDLYSRFMDLQCIFFAFQLVYMLIEQSILIQAFLIFISLLIAFTASYLTIPKSDEGERSR